MFFNEYPYRNLTDLNLDYLLKQIKYLTQQITDFVNINSIKYADPIQWNITKQYEKNTVVIDGNTGTAYLSVQAVPNGIALANTDYWTVIFTLDILQSNHNITAHDAGGSLTATFPSDEGDWILWNAILYKAIRPIVLHEAYLVGYNLTATTVDDFVHEYVTALANDITELSNDITALANKVGDLTDLDTTDKSNLVNAINEVLSTISTVAGDLTDLDTTDKSNLVNAINEVLSTISTVAGDLTDLDTTDKSNLVNAINEVLSTAGTKIKIWDISEHGAIADGTTNCASVINAGLSNNYIVYIPHGNYATSKITVPANGVIVGTSYINGTVLKALSNDSVFEIGGDGVIIKNLTIDGQATDSSSNVCGITSISGANEYLIDHVRAINCSIGFNLSSCGWSTIRDCISEQNFSDGYHLSNDNEYRPMQMNFINCLAEFNDGCGYRITNNQASVAPMGTFLNCATYANKSFGCKLEGALAAGRFVQCFFGSDGDTELHISGNVQGYTTTITGCQFELSGMESCGRNKATPATNIGNGIVSNAGCDISVDNCMIADCAGYGAAVVAATINIKNCKFRNSSYATLPCDILSQSGSKININGCIFESAATTGYVVYADNANDNGIITNCQFSRPLGVYKVSSKLYLINNIASDGTLIP